MQVHLAYILLIPTNNMRFIPLTNSQYPAIVDDEDYGRIMALNTKWCLNRSKTSMTITSTRRLYGTRHISLARFIWKIHRETVPYVDHKFGNIFDNRKEFTRLATHRQNLTNSGKQSNNTSGFLGVHFHKKQCKWVAKGYIKRVSFHLGTFDNKEDAAKAYDKFAKEHYGEFAVLNFK